MLGGRRIVIHRHGELAGGRVKRREHGGYVTGIKRLQAQTCGHGATGLTPKDFFPEHVCDSDWLSKAIPQRVVFASMM